MLVVYTLVDLLSFNDSDILLWGSTILPYLFPCHLSWTKVFVLIRGIILLPLNMTYLVAITFVDLCWLHTRCHLSRCYVDIIWIHISRFILYWLSLWSKRGKIFDCLTWISLLCFSFPDKKGEKDILSAFDACLWKTYAFT